MAVIAGTKLFLLDMDGTIYLENELLDGAKDFLNELDARGISYMFLTNNSSKTAADYAVKLKGLGIDVGVERIITSGDATADYCLEHYAEAKFHVCATRAFCTNFFAHGFKRAGAGAGDVALLAYDTELTYKKLKLFCDNVRDGAVYIATHGDFNCPAAGGGYAPDIGSFIALIKASTGREPDVVIGKPNEHIVNYIAKRTGIAAQHITMVGDRLYTDIAMGAHGIKTVLTLTGEGTLLEMQRGGYTPDAVVQNLREIVALL